MPTAFHFNLVLRLIQHQMQLRKWLIENRPTRPGQNAVSQANLDQNSNQNATVSPTQLNSSQSFNAPILGHHDQGNSSVRYHSCGHPVKPNYNHDHPSTHVDHGQPSSRDYIRADPSTSHAHPLTHDYSHATSHDDDKGATLAHNHNES